MKRITLKIKEKSFQVPARNVPALIRKIRPDYPFYQIKPRDQYVRFILTNNNSDKITFNVPNVDNSPTYQLCIDNCYKALQCI